MNCEKLTLPTDFTADKAKHHANPVNERYDLTALSRLTIRC